MLIVQSLLATLLVASPDSMHAREILVPTTRGHAIAAVIESAARTDARPAVILISGAGAHDRDGYTVRTAEGHNDAFRELSARLVALGFTVVRFDKVGTGASTGDYATATTATLALDVAALVSAIRLAPEVDPDRVTLLGHSEGGAIAAMVAADDPRIAGVALLAAPAWTGRRVMAHQLRHAAERQIRTVSYTSADLVEAFLARDSQARAASDGWYSYFLDYDPLPAMRLVKAPALVLHGEDDDVVTAEQAGEIVAALRAGGNESVRSHVLPGYTHALADPAPVGSRDPAPLGREIIALVEDWLVTTHLPVTSADR
jgi:pimeloyl-ACP methyl ester carboxylesterase